MDKPEFRVERGPATTDETFAIGMAKLLEREGRTIAAAELRRLHAENERLHQINRSHEMKLSVRGYEIQIADLEAQRDALLEVLKAMLEQFNYHTISGIVHDESSAIDRARAAIRARTP